MTEICADNRFEIIADYKRRLIEGTNIETRPEEMAVLDSILFRFWQMGWLEDQIVRCKDCRYYNTVCCSYGYGWCENRNFGTHDEWYCADGEAGMYETD